MFTRSFVRVAVAALIVAAATTPAAAQFGTYTWQMQPYCNVITLTLAPSPGGATVSGFDNLCGAPDRASAVGMASQNAGGNVTLSFSVVTTPNARPVHVVAVVNLSNGNGSWTDSGGSTGTMVFNGNAAGLPLRPVPVTQLGPNVISTLEIAPGAVGIADVNTGEVQARITGTCPTGQAMTGVNANGTVACASITGGGGGTGVYFKAGGNVTSNYLTGNVFTPVPWTQAIFNVGGGTFTPGTSTYTAPSAGLYLLTATVPVTGFQTDLFYCGGFQVNGTTSGIDCKEYVTNASINTNWISLSTTVQLAAGDTVTVALLPLALGQALRVSGTNFAESTFTATKLQ